MPQQCEDRAWTWPWGFNTHQVLLDVLIRVHVRVGRLEVSL